MRTAGARAAFGRVAFVVAWLGVATLIARYREWREAGPAAPTTRIVVASQGLSLATRIRLEQVRLADWPVADVPPGAFHDVAEVAGRILTSPVPEGLPVVSGKLSHPDVSNGLFIPIPPNMRAIAVRVDDKIGVAGFLHPDDRVDVIVTVHPSKPSDVEPISKMIVENVKVLAVGKDLEVSEAALTQVSFMVATLLVTPEQSEKITLAANEGRIDLLLRDWADRAAVLINRADRPGRD
jgi:pilus assembly protein CpaB